MFNTYDTSLVLGRFQLFHKGHQSLIETALRLSDRVYIMVGSAQESGTERNPFNIATRIDMLKEIYGGDNRVHIVAISDLTNESDDNNIEWGNFVFDTLRPFIHKAPELMIYGDDRRHKSGWFSDESLKNTMEIINPRSRIPISATMLRDLMVRDEREEWMKWVDPKLHKMYDRLRAELMEVEFYFSESKK